MPKNFTTPMDYEPRPGGRFRSFVGSQDQAPYKWPQDTLKVPNGFGSLPEVSHLNTVLSGAEFFGVNAVFTNTTVSAVETQSVTLPDDADFWCDNIQVKGISSTDGSGYTPFLYLQITDANTGYDFFSSSILRPGIPLVLLSNCDNFSFTATPGSGIPSGAGTRVDWMQPYCFTRGGSIRMTISDPHNFSADGISQDIYISLVGWKEYSNAAK